MRCYKDDNRYQLGATVLALVSLVSKLAASSPAGVAGLTMMWVLVVAAMVTLLAWCVPLVIDSYHRTVDEIDERQRRRRGG